MIRFRYENVNYIMPNSAYDTSDYILLPDGRVLRTDGWLESLPPQPFRLEEVDGKAIPNGDVVGLNPTKAEIDVTAG